MKHNLNKIFSLQSFIIITGILILTQALIISDVQAEQFIQQNLSPTILINHQRLQVDQIYLPLVMTTTINDPKVNVPYFDGDIEFSKTAILWFGNISPTDNYTDVRVGYSEELLFIHLSVFDRRLWYDTAHTISTLENWDAAIVLLDLDGNQGGTPDANSYKFVAQLNWWEDDKDWQASYVGNGSEWNVSSLPFNATSEWRGNALNDDINDRGWTMTFRIPFESLGLSSPPTKGDVWGLSFILHDRDDVLGTPIDEKKWPNFANQMKPATWGRLAFGLPEYLPPIMKIDGTTTIRHKLEGGNVVDAHVGGHTNCGQDYGPDFSDGWGDANYAGYEQINIQNQSDVADWPCFSKFFITFPLDQIPYEKEIISASLVIYQFGNAGGDSSGNPPVSYIQVLTAMSEWDESTITWNNAPLAQENFMYTAVDPILQFPGWPGVPHQWDVSQAVADAYIQRASLSLVLYSADSSYHSGKYFISSDTGDWNELGRPTLIVEWGDKVSTNQ